MSLYFNELIECFEYERLVDKKSQKKIRKNVKGFIKNTSIFSAGDILKVVFFCKNMPFIFEGICLGVSKRKFLLPDVAFILRNVIMGVCLEVTFSYYYNRLYTLRINDWKKKFNFFYRSKLYFIRKRLNKESKVI